MPGLSCAPTRLSTRVSEICWTLARTKTLSFFSFVLSFSSTICGRIERQRNARGGVAQNHGPGAGRRQSSRLGLRPCQLRP